MVKFGQESKRKRLENFLEDIAEYQQEMAQIEGLDREAGVVIATSGTRVVEARGYTWALDWAAVQLLPKRPMKDIIEHTKKEQFIHGMRGEELREWSVSMLQPGIRVSKRGRTTGWTEGYVNSIKADLNITRKEGNKAINPYKGTITAWVVHNSFGMGKFCDSGSIILNSRTTSQLGLMFGNDLYTGFGYFTPFDLVIRDIENITGGRVVKPTHNDG